MELCQTAVIGKAMTSAECTGLYSVISDFGRFKQGGCLELKAILGTLGALGPSVQQTKGLISKQEERRENWFFKYREHI